MVRHGHPGGAVLAFQQFHIHHLGGAERLADKGGRVFTPADDVNFLAAQLIHNLRHTRAARANAGAHRVYVFVLGPHRHLRAGAGLTADGLNLHRAVINFRHFHLEHALHKAGVGAANHHARAALCLAHIHHIHLQVLALIVFLAGHLFVARQRGHAALRKLQRHNAARHIQVCHRGRDNLVRVALHLGVHLAALGLFQALANDVLCRLRGNAAEILRFQGNDKICAQL